MTTSADAIAIAETTLAANSKSFALAARWLPNGVRQDAAVLYAWCRQADDRIDLAPADRHATELRLLRAELEVLYGEPAADDPQLRLFQEMLRRHQIPRRYLDELIEGLAMDARGERYRTTDELLVYCFRVAGTVGLMMAHLMGVKAGAAFERAADLGRAMQLTNICRDVAEDVGRGRLYLPYELLGRDGGVTGRVSSVGDLGDLDRIATGPAVAALLERAETLYASGWRGLGALPLRCALAIGVAASVYRDIGRQIARGGFDVRRGRAVVPRWKKYLLAAQAAARVLAARLSARWLETRWFRSFAR